MGFFSLHETCVICGFSSGLLRTHTTIGPICKECLHSLVEQGITAYSIKNHDLHSLQVLCNIATNKTEKNGSSYSQLKKQIIENPSISLKDGEVCFYQRRAAAFHQKNVITGSKSNGIGLNMRIAKGLSLRTGTSASTAIRENVSELFEGMLYITNMRITLLAPKYGFDVLIPKITSISQRSDGLLIYAGSKCHCVYTTDVKSIVALLQTMNRAYDERPIEAYGSTKRYDRTRNDASELREFKKLLDDGIITQEEFDRKKRQILDKRR